MSFVEAKSKADFKSHLFTTLLLRCEPADFLHLFPHISSSFPLISPHYLPPTPTIVGPFPCRSKEFLSNLKISCFKRWKGKPRMSLFALMGILTLRRLNWNWNHEGNILHFAALLVPWHFAQGDTCWKGDKICHLHAYRWNVTQFFHRRPDGSSNG